MKRFRQVAVVATLSGLGLVIATVPAQAQSYSAQKTISCDVTITTNVVTLNQAVSGPMTYAQNDTTPTVQSYVWATSSNGNSVGAKAVTDGNSVKWSGVLPSNYTFKTHVTSSYNCNGGWPGDGNATLTFKAATS